MHFAADFGRSRCLEILLDVGADKEARNFVRTLSTLAARLSTLFSSRFRSARDVFPEYALSTLILY